MTVTKTSGLPFWAGALIGAVTIFILGFLVSLMVIRPLVQYLSTSNMPVSQIGLVVAGVSAPLTILSVSFGAYLARRLSRFSLSAAWLAIVIATLMSFGLVMIQFTVFFDLPANSIAPQIAATSITNLILSLIAGGIITIIHFVAGAHRRPSETVSSSFD